MRVFVTGATGFIGRHLLTHLLARKGDVYCLVRKGSQQKFDALRERTGAWIMLGQRQHFAFGLRVASTLPIQPRGQQL